jgi:hypothetical protein
LIFQKRDQLFVGWLDRVAQRLIRAVEQSIALGRIDILQRAYFLGEIVQKRARLSARIERLSLNNLVTGIEHERKNEPWHDHLLLFALAEIDDELVE